MIEQLAPRFPHLGLKHPILHNNSYTVDKLHNMSCIHNNFPNISPFHFCIISAGLIICVHDNPMGSIYSVQECNSISQPSYTHFEGLKARQDIEKYSICTNSTSKVVIGSNRLSSYLTAQPIVCSTPEGPYI